MANKTVEAVPILIAAGDAARMWSMHRASWYKAVASGKAPASVRIGGMVRWRRNEIDAWIAAGCPPRSKWEATMKAPGLKQHKRG